MKILITGANGFVGQAIVAKLLARGYHVIATGKGECRLPFLGRPGFSYATMDFTDPFSVHDVFALHQPNIVIHSGAISKPDECEQDQWKAFLINVEGTVNLLMNAEEYKSFFILLSTDFIFDGTRGMYSEGDSPLPINYYGRTKLEAEEAVQDYAGDWAIARTVLVYGKPLPGRGNILSIVREKLEKGEVYNVVDDQVRTPTYVGDLAEGIALIIDKRATGIFHLAGKEQMTPYQMACKVADYLSLDKKYINRVTADSFSQPARRPLKTGFLIEKSRKELNYEPLTFEEGLRRTFNEF